jgi:hypothetical protein
MITIQEQICEWFNCEDFDGRKKVIEELKQITSNLEGELNNTCSQCLNCFEDCDCENSNI